MVTTNTAPRFKEDKQQDTEADSAAVPEPRNHLQLEANVISASSP
jgi:hypothetical protein